MPRTKEQLAALKQYRVDNKLCYDCGSTLDSSRIRCLACRSKHQKHEGGRINKLRASGYCACGRSNDTSKGSCKLCTDRRKVYNKSRKRLKLREYGLLQRYNLSLEQYDYLAADQGNTCKICGELRGKSKLVVDHCHTTGLVRGLLCHNCNVALGYFNDNPAFMRSAISYIETSASGSGGPSGS